MNRQPSSLRPLAAAVSTTSESAATMSSRPYQWRGNLPQGSRGYFTNKPSDSESEELVSGDSHFRAVQDANRGFRPSYSAVPPPPQYFTGQQFNGPRPGPNNSNQFPGPGPYRHSRQAGEPFGNYQQFRPTQSMQQNFRPRASKPADYREWEYAKPVPPPHFERFTVLSYNILADYLANDHWQNLYFHIPRHMLDWNWRRRSISFELGLWSADILCFQEVDRFQDMEAELKHRGYNGIWKMRTGDPVDGCAIFWRVSRFKLLHEESIEYNKLGLRDNVAQICVFESQKEQNNANPVSSLSTSSVKSNRVVVCNIHVLFNPKRGDIKLGQIRVLLDRAHAVSKLWDDAPVVICGDFNCTPKSPMYDFITKQKLDLTELPRDKVSGQASAEIRTSRPAYPDFRAQSADRGVITGNLTGSQSEKGSPICSVTGTSDESLALEPSCESIHSKVTDVKGSVESNLETLPEASESPAVNLSVSAVGSASRESRSADLLLDKKFESFSLNESVDETKDELHEDSYSFLSELHSTGQSRFPSDLHSSSQNQELHSEILNDTLYVKDEVAIEGKSPYSPSAWTPMEIQTATGNADCMVMEHTLKLSSAYAEVKASSGLRDSSGEPLVTSYHRRFLGTVDYIWHSEGLQTAKVLAPIPKHVMQYTRGFPTKKWGSDHIALVSEFAFTKDISSENTSR
ncbi:hypothetical protein ACJIZ3_001517 [Penstemon smallii]|uniref:Endonuclease/exonuclease/phosphatase domain-containing protein n=1 Tax=Penstemon smallii TaxID=265156 RepID=A0ABD3U3U5_9LAMI